MNYARLLLMVSLALGLCTSSHAVAVYSVQAVGSSDFSGMHINNNGQVAGTFNANREVGLWDGTTLHNLGSFGATYTIVNGFNDNCQISGYTTSGPTRTAYRWDSDLITVGPTGTATGMNADGDVVGYVDSPSRVFVWDGAATTYLPSGTDGRAINDLGQVACDSSTNGYLWDGTTLHDLGSLGGIHTRPYAINNKGQVVGGCGWASGASRAFVWQDGVIQGIGAVGYGNTYAVAINERSQIVGLFSSQSAWLFENAALYDLNSLIRPNSGWRVDYVSDINDNGQILARAWDNQGAHYTVILNEVPEPTSCLALIFGLSAALPLMRRRRMRSEV